MGSVLDLAPVLVLDLAPVLVLKRERQRTVQITRFSALAINWLSLRDWFDGDFLIKEKCFVLVPAAIAYWVPVPLEGWQF